MSGQRVPISGSAPKPAARQELSTALSPDTAVTATLVLRRRADSSAPDEAALFSGNFAPMSRDDAARQIGADPADLAAVEDFARRQGLSISNENPAARTLQVTGSASQIGEAFGTSLDRYQSPGNADFISYEGQLSVPAELSGIIVAVLGLDQRPIAKHHASS